jgi:hypothetical protein
MVTRRILSSVQWVRMRIEFRGHAVTSTVQYVGTAHEELKTNAEFRVVLWSDALN